MEEDVGKAESAVPGSGVKRSRDGTQRKAARSASLVAGTSIMAAATRRDCATRRGGREMRDGP
jgi:hypothetical protein